MLSDEQRARLRGGVNEKSGSSTTPPDAKPPGLEIGDTSIGSTIRTDRAPSGVSRLWLMVGGLALVAVAVMVFYPREAPKPVVAQAPAPSQPAVAAAEPAPVVAAPSPKAGGLKSFSEEVRAVKTSIGCEGKITAAGYGLGPLYGCIAGRAETAKAFVNGAADGAEARNIKVMWNQWTQDTGYGVSADRSVARKMVGGVVRHYAPELGAKVAEAFMSDVENEQVFKGAGLNLTVRKTNGPAIREHLLIIETDGG